MLFDQKQLEAITMCSDTSIRMCGITGGAGTGKTTIIREVYEKLRGRNDVVICAPTGKAAKRITEATGFEAMTLHRLLEYPMPNEEVKKKYEPKRNRSNRLDYNIVLCDEFSMVNWQLYRALGDAIPNGGCLRVFGDANQLNPIENDIVLEEDDSPFKMILKKFPKVVLNVIHRQGEGSIIVENGNKIINGKMPLSTDEFRLIGYSERKAVDVIEKIINNDKEYFGQKKQFIVPVNKGDCGTYRLNNFIQMQKYGIFTQKEFKDVDRNRWDNRKRIKIFIDDKVIITKNDYDLDVFNGENGTVVDINKNGDILIDFGDRIGKIPEVNSFHIGRKEVIYNPQMNIDLGYVITTHKSQGSEYDEICYILDGTSYFMQNKNNFYTAITRARKKVLVVTDIKCLKKSLTEQK